MPTLSKSKIIAFRQCPKRLWLEVHHPELREDSASSQSSFAVGNRVGEIARQIYDPAGKGALIELDSTNIRGALKLSAEIFQDGTQTVFEAGFQHDGTWAFADIMLPVRKRGSLTWKMVEVKSSTKVKDYHRDDIAIQTFLARSMGLSISSAVVAAIDSKWTYPGNSDYQGLLAENDLTQETLERAEETADWIRQAHKVARQKNEPNIETGEHCSQPFECGFCNYCNRDKIPAENPIGWLPRLNLKQKSQLKELGIEDMRDVPDEILRSAQQLVRRHTLDGTTYFDCESAAKALKGLGFPATFLDFETINHAVPVWPGTCPYQQIPFQFSAHRLGKNGKLDHVAFLDLTGDDPSRKFAEAVIKACGRRGPVFVYNVGFERRILKELAERLTDLAPQLEAITNRLFDLLPVARECFYHPSQCGSWSIKSVLPAAVPTLSYDNLNGVKNGGMAMIAYAEAILPETTPERREQIRNELLAYCCLDTLAIVELWRFFRNEHDPDECEGFLLRK